MRYPDISGDRITFVYAEKLWVADASGAHPTIVPSVGTELSRPHFSPDGKRIAFSARVDGNIDIYLVTPGDPAPPKRLTHHPAADLVVDWDPKGENILFASTMTSPRAVYDQFQLVSAKGGLPQRVPLPYGETAAYSDDGKQLLFTYQRDFQEEAWKRYYGGRAPDIWSYDFRSGDTHRLTVHQASDSMPMRVNGHTFFLSERDDNGRSNIWRLGEDGKPDEAVTRYGDTDIRRPATDGHRIIFEADGRLVLFDPVTSSTSPLKIEIARATVESEPKPVPVADRLTSAALGPGRQVAIEARGDVFLYDTRSKAARNITASPGSAERFPRQNARGDVAFISDRDGEYALYVQAADNSAVRKLADFGTGFRYSPFWSPDGRSIALFDQTETIWVVDVASGAKTRVDQGKWWYHTDLVDLRLSWSPDSRWLTYSRGLDNRNQAVFVYDTKTQTRHQLTSGAFNDFAPVFDLSGNYLLMLSNRKFDPTFGDTNFDATWTYTDGTVVSAIPLNQKVPAPGRTGRKAPPTQSAVTIDLEYMERRLAVLGGASGAFTALASAPDGFVVIRQGRSDGGKNSLERYGFGKEGHVTLQEEIGLSIADADASRILTRADTKLFLARFDAPKPRPLDTGKLVVTVDDRAEAQQMFNDAWRYGRDFYYDTGMHGIDWAKARERMGALVPFVVIDDDITFIVRELMGELNGGHIYASATAPRPRGDAQNVGLLGVDFAAGDGGYRIAKIYRTGARAFEVRSPLDDASLDVHEGDYILAVDGKPLLATEDPWAPFSGLAGQEVELRIASGGASAPRTIRVKALKSERKLRELAWVEENRRKVEAASDGHVGYIYVPNTGTEGQNELMIQYRSQFNKDALIVDERFNTGGALGDRMIELLNRPPLVIFRARNSLDYSLPELAHRGPKVMISNGWSYSGGDGFPLLFKIAKLGPLIGTRTWGGLIGPGLTLPLINGGFISSPPIRVYGTDGRWSEGNEGVHPNEEIDNDPGQLGRGTDQQLDRAIQLMMLQSKTLKPLAVPPFPGAGDWNPAKRGQ